MNIIPEWLLFAGVIVLSSSPALPSDELSREVKVKAKQGYSWFQDKILI